MVPFKINGKKYNIPSQWEDLTFKQYIGVITNTEKLAGLINLFTGIDAKAAKYEGLEELLLCLSFLQKTPKFEGVITKIGPYDLPINHKKQFNIQFESLGQFEDLRSVMLKQNGESEVISLLQAQAKYVAIYLQKIRDGEYNYEKAMVMAETDIQDLPAHQVITLGSFFLVKLLSLLTGTQSSYQNITQSQKKKKPGWVISKRRSDHTPVLRKYRNK